MEEWNDIYDQDRKRTGRLHRRGDRWEPGEYGLVVCVWVYDGRGRILLTRRAPEKSFAGTWENSGGAARAGENSRQAVSRELFEETGIRAHPREFEYIGSDRDRCTFYDFYCLRRELPLEKLRLQPGETDDARWATLEEVRSLIQEKKICRIIAHQFRRQERHLLRRQDVEEK